MRQSQAPDFSEHEPLLSNAFLYRLTGAIACLALATASISYAGRWYGGELALAGHSDSQALHQIAIGNDTISVAANMIRFSEQRTDGPAERLNLYLTWPDMQGFSQPQRNRFDQLSLSNSLIFIEMSEATMSRDMSGRLEPIYARLFDGEGVPAGNGLTLHHLRPESGYGDEVVLTGSRDGKPDYAVRCTLPKAPAVETAGDCQRDIHLGAGLSVLYRFSSTLLNDWNHIDAAIERFVVSHLVTETGS